MKTIPVTAALVGRDTLTLGCLAFVALCSLAGAASGQDTARPPAGAGGMGIDEQIVMAVEQAMGEHIESNIHLALTPLKAPAPGDSARAAKVADELRAGIAKYKDPSVAVADGFRMFAPRVKDQPVYHYVHATRMLREQTRWDPASPSSLIYRRAANGQLELFGAMYMASPRATPEELDARVPLSVARWHKHVNYCFPEQRRRITETKDGMPLFGPVGTIATRAECEAAGGRFTPQIFGWMVHANVYAGTDPKSIWGSGHGHSHGPPHP
jgi:hypothetical protein